MRKWSITLLVLALLSGVYTVVNQAQEVTGTIYGTAPPGYHVAIQGTSLNTVADPKSGKFTIEKVPVGTFLLLVASDSSMSDVWLMGNVFVRAGGERVEVPRLVHVSPQTVPSYISDKPEQESPYKLLQP